MTVDFAGTDDQVDCGDINALDGVSAISVSAWVRTDVITGGGDNLRYAVNKESGAANYPLILRLETTPVRMGFYVGGTASGSAATPNSSIATNTWYQVVGTYDGTTVYIYLDGTRYTGSTTSGAVGSSATSLFIGGDTVGTARFWDGQIEDVRVWTRALTQEEVAILAAGDRGPMGGEVGWWTCDNFRGLAHPDGSTLTAATHYLRDESGNGNTGDPKNGVIARASDVPRTGRGILP